MSVQIPLLLEETTGQSCHEGIRKLLAQLPPPISSLWASKDLKNFRVLLQLIKCTSTFSKTVFTIMLCLHFQWKPCLPPAVHGDSDTSGLSSKVSLEAFSCWSQRKYSSLRIQQREWDNIWSWNMDIFDTRGNYFKLACFFKKIYFHCEFFVRAYRYRYMYVCTCINTCFSHNCLCWLQLT